MICIWNCYYLQQRPPPASIQSYSPSLTQSSERRSQRRFHAWALVGRISTWEHYNEICPSGGLIWLDGRQNLNLRAFITMKYVQVVVWYDLIVYRGQAKRLWLKQHRGSEDRNMLVESSQNFRTCFFIKSILLLNFQMSFCFVQICYLTLSYLFVKWLKTIALNVLMLNVQTILWHTTFKKERERSIPCPDGNTNQ